MKLPTDLMKRTFKISHFCPAVVLPLVLLAACLSMSTASSTSTAHASGVPGQSESLDVDPTSHLLWIIANSAANPELEIIDPTSGTASNYTFPKTPHGGGYEGLSFINGMAFISASNPALNNSGVNVFPAVDKISLSSGQVMLTAVLPGNAQAIDITSGDNNSLGSLNETDPEALSTDTKGDLVLLNQARAEAVFIAQPATAGQKVSRLSK